MTTPYVDTTEEITLQETMFPIVVASTVGSAIEWFDFFYYGFLAATVFPAIFFPGLDTSIGIVASFTTNFIGFVARPLGSMLFGYVGDRSGRQSTLATTLLLVGITTMFISVLPGYTTLGIAAPLLLVLLRFLQGVGVGGEWGGSTLLSMEFGNQRQRGFLTSWTQSGAFVGIGLSIASLLLFQNLYPGGAFQSVGWRMPFLLSTILVLVGLYIRLRIPETPAFLRMKTLQHAAQPIQPLWRHYWRDVLLSALVRTGEQAPFYIFTLFMLSYGVDVLHLDTTFLYLGLLLASIVAFCVTPAYGALSDRIGRRLMIRYGVLLMSLFAFPYFFLLNTRNPFAVVLAIVLSLGGCHACIYGPQAAFIAERFPTRFRYTGATLGYQLASIIAGGPAPIVATYLLDRGRSQANIATVWIFISIYIVIMAFISLLATFFMKEYAGQAAVEETA
jgi:Na+/melibiose symporter and related transporters